MIINLFFVAIVSVFGAVMYLFPTAHLHDLPFIGVGIVTTLTLVMTTWNSFMDIFPYVDIVWSVFLYVIIPFEILIILLKVFLGARAPVADK